LQLSGYGTFQACNGDEGLKLAEEHSLELIITDLLMPGMNGFEFSRRVREISNARIMILSGLDEQSYSEDSTGLIDAFMTKPIMLQEFLSVVESIITGNAIRETQHIGAVA